MSWPVYQCAWQCRVPHMLACWGVIMACHWGRRRFLLLACRDSSSSPWAYRLRVEDGVDRLSHARFSLMVGVAVWFTAANGWDRSTRVELKHCWMPTDAGGRGHVVTQVLVDGPEKVSCIVIFADTVKWVVWSSPQILSLTWETVLCSGRFRVQRMAM